MSDHLRIVLRTFPECTPEWSYPAALTRYHLRLTVTAMERQSLSIMARFMLRAVALGVVTAPELAHLFGLEEADLAGAGAELLQARLVTYGMPNATGYRPLILTPRGIAFLSEERNLAVPRTRTVHVHFDPLTVSLHPTERGAISPEEARRRGLFVLPNPGGPPGIDDISIDNLRQSLSLDNRFPADIEVARVLGMQEPYVEYVTDCVLVLLRHRETAEERLAVFRGGKYLAAESEATERQRERGVKIVPADSRRPLGAALNVGTLVPQAAAQPLTQILQNDDHLCLLQRRIAALDLSRTFEQDHRRQRELESEASGLRTEVQALEQDRITLRQVLRDVTAETADVLRAEQHRPLLEDALQRARREVIILCPWLDLRAADSRLCTLIASALRRGVQVHIGYGYRDNGAEGTRNRQGAAAVRDHLRRCAGATKGTHLLVLDVGEVVENVLLCDETWGVLTTYSWLAPQVDLDRDPAPSSGLILREPLAVGALARRVPDALRTAQAETLLPPPIGSRASLHG